MFSQFENLQCGFTPDAGMYETSKYSATVKSDFSTDEPIIFNVFYHVMNPSNGINPWGLTEEHILASIARLNVNYNQYNIFYKYTGFRTINDDAIYNANESQFESLLNLNQDFPNSINVMVTPPISHAGIAYRVDQWVKYPAYLMINTNFDNITIVHEFGHLAGLLHTHAGTVGVIACRSSPNSGYCVENTICPPIFDETESEELLNTPHFATPDHWSEHVTRDVTNLNYNADVKGDMVVDTPAAFYGSENNYCFDIATGTLNYIIHQDIVDSTDANELYVDVDLTNIMSFGIRGRNHFTNGQAVRMREEILSPSNTQYTPRLALLDDGTADLSVLYEPYKEIENFYTTKYFFQPGFDYDFVNCDSNGFHGGYPTPSDYDDISFVFNDNGYNNWSYNKYYTSFKYIYQRDHTSIRISQIDDYQPRRCYSTELKGGASSGTVIKYEDDYPNTNVTIQHKNATEINNENLIQNLENGLYIIIKTFDDGTQEQKTIFKNDN